MRPGAHRACPAPPGLSRPSGEGFADRRPPSLIPPRKCATRARPSGGTRAAVEQVVAREPRLPDAGEHLVELGRVSSPGPLQRSADRSHVGGELGVRHRLERGLAPDAHDPPRRLVLEPCAHAAVCPPRELHEQLAQLSGIEPRQVRGQWVSLRRLYRRPLGGARAGRPDVARREPTPRPTREASRHEVQFRN